MSISDNLPRPEFSRIVDIHSLEESALQEPFNASATFYRNVNNTNILMSIPLGTNTNGVYVSPMTYLPAFSFNSVKNTSQVLILNNVDAKILQSMSLYHNIIIQYKISNSNNYNFLNQRELRITLVDGNNNPYNATIFSNSMPDTGAHDTVIINQYIDHAVNDVVKLAFMVTQNSDGINEADTLLTIMRISWNISN